MPEIANREQIEAQIVAELEPVFEAQYRRALSSPASIPYAEFQTDLSRVMAKELADVFQQAGAALLIGHAVVLSAGAFEQTAQRWSSQYSAELAREIVESSQRLVGQQLSEARGDKQLVREGLAAVFMSGLRLENISITEVTTATSAGEQSAVLFYHQDESRPRLIPIWVTRQDADVCEHCDPLQGRSREVWAERFPLGPPGHPRCRCFIEWVRAAEWARRAA